MKLFMLGSGLAMGIAVVKGTPIAMGVGLVVILLVAYMAGRWSKSGAAVATAVAVAVAEAKAEAKAQALSSANAQVAVAIHQHLGLPTLAGGVSPGPADGLTAADATEIHDAVGNLELPPALEDELEALKKKLSPEREKVIDV